MVSWKFPTLAINIMAQPLTNIRPTIIYFCECYGQMQDALKGVSVKLLISKIHLLIHCDMFAQVPS